MIYKLPTHEKNYTKVDNQAINDSRLSYRARGILCMLLSKRSDWRVNIKHLAQSGNISSACIRSSLKELARYGYARLIANYDTGSARLNGKTWEIFETPDLNPSFHSRNNHEENPNVGFSRNSEKRDVWGNRNSEKCSVLITEETEITEPFNNDGQKRIKRESEKSDTRPSENWRVKNIDKNTPSLPSSAAPPFPVYSNVGCTFSQSKYVTDPEGFNLFCTDLIARGEYYVKADLDYYYRRVKDWSDSTNAVRVNWIAQAASIIENDHSKNKLKISKNHEPTTIDGLDAEKVLRRATRFVANNRAQG